MKILDATFKIADGVKRRRKNDSIVETTTFKQTLIISVKTTKKDENGAVHIEVEPKAYIHMNSKTANAYKDALTELLEIGKDYSDENQMIIPGNYLIFMIRKKFPDNN